MEKDLQENRVIEAYKQDFRDIMPLLIPSLTPDEVDRALDYSIDKRFTDHNISIHNSYKHAKVDMSLVKFANYVMDKKPIMTPYGVIFSRHGTVPNPLYKMVDDFVNTRQKFKKKMFQYPKGTEEFNKYNLLQLVAKVDVNAIYGAIGAMSSIFYNIYCAGAVTSAGRGAISASITLFESFLADNVKFSSLNEVMTFIKNVTNEKNIRKFKDDDILDEYIDDEMCFGKLILECGYEWIPTERECEIIWEAVTRLTPEDKNRVFYKNNLYRFCNNNKISNIIVDILCTLKAPFLDPNHPPKEIKDKLEYLLELIKEYVYYGYIFIDKLDRIETMIRQIVLITDTDSCIISLEHWYQFVLGLTKNIDMRVKHQLVEVVKRVKRDEFGDPIEDLVAVAEEDDPRYAYDFYNDEITEIRRSASPVYTPPADGFRHSIINIMSYCVSQLILDYMDRYTMHYNSWDKNRTCMLIMKNEFLFKAIMLTNGKKNYASIQEVQEGNIVPPEAGLAISGLPLDKVGIPESTSKVLKRIIRDQILDAQDIDQLAILSELAILQKKIYNSLINGEVEYYKVARIKPANAYANPMSTQGIKASVAYNALKNPHEEEINLDQGNTIILIKTNLDKKNIVKSQVDHPDFYERAMKVLDTDAFKGKIETVAVMMGNPVPKWIIPYINYAEIVHDNLAAFPLESIGLNRIDNSHITFSNILSL